MQVVSLDIGEEKADNTELELLCDFFDDDGDGEISLREFLVGFSQTLLSNFTQICGTFV